MTNKAKLYIAGVNAAGLTFLAAAMLTWHSENPVYYAAFSLLAPLGATRKIRLPGMTATMSLNFLFILVGIAQFSYSETLVMATAAALVQSLWNASQRPKLVQTLFGVATMSVSTALTYFFSNLALNSANGESLAGLLMLATSLLLLFNTGLVAGVLALVDNKRLTTVWRGCYMHAFPYFAIGAALAGAVCSAEKAVGWQSTLILVPFTYLLYIFYRFHLERQARQGHEAVTGMAAD